jgi:C-terminal processing protease CtpA/Prc
MLKTRKGQILWTTLLVSAVLFFWFEKSVLPGGPQRRVPPKNNEILSSVIRYIKSDYLEDADPKKTMEGAFQGLVNSLDVLSAFLDKAAVAKYISPQKLRLKDVGVVLFKRYGFFPLVIGVAENSPADKAGIRIGDYLSALDDRSTLIWSLPEIHLYLKNESPAAVKIRVIRENSTKEMNVERGDLYPRPLTTTPLGGTSGIVKIHHFYPSLTAEFQKSVLPGVRGRKLPLVLDFRDCHEGDNAEARSFLNVFLKAEKIGYFEKKAGVKEFLSCPDEAPLDALPLILWVNQATIGPAEMAAGVLQDIKKASVIGVVTPGLVARQDLFPLENGDALLLSTGIFCFNSGEKLWSKGVTPGLNLDPGKTDTKAYIEKTIGLLSRR